MNKNKKIIWISLMISMGVMIGFFESLIPLPILIPGARLGLSNIVVLVTIVNFGYKNGFLVSFFKTLLLILINGNIMSFAFSFTGALFSFIAMSLSYKYLNRYLSLIGISELGSFFHNLGQIIAASLILQSKQIFLYFPFLVLLGIFTGFFIGLSSIFIVNNLNKNKGLLI